MKKVIPEIIEPWFFTPNGEFYGKVANDYQKSKSKFLLFLKRIFKSKQKHVNHTI